MPNKYRGYRLSLGDGNRWWITGDEALINWVDKFSTIMKLEPCESKGFSKIIFSKMKDVHGAKSKENDEFYQNGGCRNFEERWISYKDINLGCQNNMSGVTCEVNNDIDGGREFLNMWAALQLIYQKSIAKGGLPFHAGLVELDGQGILLAGPGGRGKSTCCRHLPGYWKVLSDDETLIVRGKNTYLAHPFPTWSDYLRKRAQKTWNIQYFVAVCAIFFIEHAKTDGVVPIGNGQAATLMNESANQVCCKFWHRLDKKNQRDYKRKVFSNACEMAREIPAFRLRVSLEGKFWEKMEKVIDRLPELNSNL